MTGAADGGHLVDARVVITGGLGFLGSNLAHRLAPDNDVVVVDSLAPNAGGNRNNLVGVGDACSLVEADLDRPGTYEDERVRAALRDATHIFHCAARTSHPGSMADPLGDLEANGRATLRLLEHLRSSDADARVVHPATTSQTGPMVHAPIDETHPEFPRDVYSAHKSLQEKYVLVYAHAHGLDAVAVRLSNVYGPRAAIHTPALGFANYFVGLGLQEAPITIYGDGLQGRSILYVDDALDALTAAARAPGVAGEVFQAADPEGTTVLGFAEAVARVVGGTVRKVPYPADRARTEIGNASYSIRKSQEQLGWRPRTKVEEGLTATAAYYRTRLYQYLVAA